MAEKAKEIAAPGSGIYHRVLPKGEKKYE